MQTKRDQAIRLLGDLLYTVGGPRPTDEKIGECVDAIIEAARAPESAHTRAMGVDLASGGDRTVDPRR